MTAATSRGAAGVLGQHLDHLALDEGRVDVQHDQPLGPPVQAGPLDGDVDAQRRGGQREPGPQLGRGCAGDLHLHRRDGVVGDPHDPVDVGPAAGDAPGQPGHRLPACSGCPSTVTWLRPRRRGSSCSPSLLLRATSTSMPIGARTAVRAASTALVARGRCADQDAEDQPTADDDLLDVQDGDLVGGQRIEQR